MGVTRLQYNSCPLFILLLCMQQNDYQPMRMGGFKLFLPPTMVDRREKKKIHTPLPRLAALIPARAGSASPPLAEGGGAPPKTPHVREPSVPDSQSLPDYRHGMELKWRTPATSSATNNAPEWPRIMLTARLGGTCHKVQWQWGRRTRGAREGQDRERK